MNLPAVLVEKRVPDFEEFLFVKSKVQSLNVRPKGAASVLSPVVTGLLNVVRSVAVSAPEANPNLTLSKIKLM